MAGQEAVGLDFGEMWDSKGESSCVCFFRVGGALRVFTRAVLTPT